MNENVILMMIAMLVAICNFWVVLLNLKFIEKDSAKFFVAANFALGVLNLATAIKYLLK